MRSGIAWAGSKSVSARRELARHCAVQQEHRGDHARPGEPAPRAARAGRRIRQPASHASYSATRVGRRAVLGRLELHGAGARAAERARAASASSTTRWSRLTRSVVSPLGTERAQRLVEAAQAPAAGGEDLVAGRQAGALAGAVAQHMRHLHAGERALADAHAETLRQRRRPGARSRRRRAAAAARAAARRCRAPRRRARPRRSGRRRPRARRRCRPASIGPPLLVPRGGASRRRACRWPSLRNVRSSASATSEPLA